MKSIALGFSVLCCALIMFAWSQPVKAGQAEFKCPVVDVATFTDRVHIHCAPGLTACSLTPGGCPEQPVYFAVETSSPMAASVVQSGIGALSNNHYLQISYDDNSDDNPAGCLQQDCRRIVGVVVR
jgi:hypothetical protein